MWLIITRYEVMKKYNFQHFRIFIVTQMPVTSLPFLIKAIFAIVYALLDHKVCELTCEVKTLSHHANLVMWQGVRPHSVCVPHEEVQNFPLIVSLRSNFEIHNNNKAFLWCHSHRAAGGLNKSQIISAKRPEL